MPSVEDTPQPGPVDSRRLAREAAAAERERCAPKKVGFAAEVEAKVAAAEARLTKEQQEKILSTGPTAADILAAEEADERIAAENAERKRLAEEGGYPFEPVYATRDARDEAADRAGAEDPLSIAQDVLRGYGHDAIADALQGYVKPEEPDINALTVQAFGEALKAIPEVYAEHRPAGQVWGEGYVAGRLAGVRAKA